MKRAGDFLSAIIDENLLDKVKTYSGFFSAWAEITRHCGIAAAAGHSRVRELEKGVIVVEADHPGWVQLLQTKAQWLLQDARRRFPDLDIRGISFTLSKPDAPGSPSPAAAPKAERAPEPDTPPAPAPAEDARAPWEHIEDSDFKDSLKRLEQSISEREKRKS
jgi:hypothetical protein